MPAKRAAEERRPVAELRIHPQAGLVPPMSEEEYRGFLADVRTRRVQEPLAITSHGEVLDGRHRLRAALDAEQPEVPVRVVAPEDEAAYIVAAATTRRQLNKGQIAAILVKLGSYDAARAAGRAARQANLRNVEVAPMPHRRGRSRDALAESAGISARYLADADAIAKADPELFNAVWAGRTPLTRARQQLQRRDRYAAIAQAPPLPDGPFTVVYADPPWRSQNPDSAFSPEQHYPTLTLDEICGLPVPAAEDAVLYLWALAAQLEDGYTVIRAWGFRPTGQLVWDKGRIGLGGDVRYQHEVFLIGRRGRLDAPEPANRPASVIRETPGRHSAKPIGVYQLIETAYPGTSRVELFARGTPRSGWTAWGNEVQAA